MVSAQWFLVARLEPPFPLELPVFVNALGGALRRTFPIDGPFDRTSRLDIRAHQIARITAAFAAVAISCIIAVANVVLFAIEFGLMTQFNLRDLNVTHVLVAVTRIEVEHGSSMAHAVVFVATDRTIMASG